MNTFTTCIFLNTKNEYDVFRFKHILSPSIEFITDKILIVNEITDEIKEFKNYKILLDNDIIIINNNISNYSKQMMLKLYISKYIKTSHYLILDSDIYVTKKFKFEDLFTDGKIILSIFDADVYLNIDKYENCHQTKWILDTFKLHNKNIKSHFYYGVTPSLLITNEVKELLNFLDNKFCNFLNYFGTANIYGSEYSNYFVYVNDKDLYKPDYGKNLVSAVWKPEDSIYHLNNESVFWIIQSNTNIDNKFLLKYLNKH